MKCPRCGAENAERADRCYLCEHPLSASSDAFETSTLEGNAQQYPPQGPAVPPGQQPHPPPATGPGYQPPPDAYAAGYQPHAPAPQRPATVKIVIGALVVVLIVIVAVGAFYLTRGKTYGINVSAPPGYQEASQDLFDEFNDSMKEGSGDIAAEALFVDNSQSNFVMVASMDMPPAIGEKPPSGDDPEEMEEWFYDNRDEWEEAFNTSFAEGLGGMGSVDADLYQVERLATGDAVLHMATSVSLMDTSFNVETLWIIKERSVFFIAIMGTDTGSQTVESLKESVTFE